VGPTIDSSYRVALFLWCAARQCPPPPPMAAACPCMLPWEGGGRQATFLWTGCPDFAPDRAMASHP